MKTQNLFIAILVLLIAQSCAPSKYSQARVLHYGYAKERNKAGESIGEGDCQKAEQEMLEAIRLAGTIRDTLPEEKSAASDLAEGYKLLGHIYSDPACEKYSEALSAYKKSQQLREEIYGANSVEYANVLNDIAWNYHYQTGQYEQAAELLIRALGIYQSNPNSIGYETMTFYNLGLVYQAQKEYEKAESMYKKMYDKINNWYYRGNVDDEQKRNIIRTGLQYYADFLRQQGREKEASEIESRMSVY